MQYLYVFLIAMTPVLELRGAIPYGAAAGLNWLPVVLVSIAGNMLPVPFIILFIRRILRWMKTTKHLAGIAVWVEKRALKNSKTVRELAYVGLLLFVAMPLPGTGAWTGALIAALLEMRIKYALPAILGGVVTAGVIIAGLTYGFTALVSGL